MPVLPPGGGVAICAVGRARWEIEYKANQGKIMDMMPEEVERGGTGAVLRCPVGWSGDHRIVSIYLLDDGALSAISCHSCI